MTTEELRRVIEILDDPAFKRYITEKRSNVRDRLEVEDRPELRGLAEAYRNLLTASDRIRSQLRSQVVENDS